MSMTQNAQPEAIVRQPISLLRVGAVALVVLGVFLVAWLALRGGDDDSGATATAGAPRVVSESELKSFASAVDHPVFWAGKRPNLSYELTRTADGSIYVRYLPANVKAGDKRARFLTIGTYPRTNAFAELQRAAKAEGAVSVKLGGGGLMVFGASRPTSVYVGYPKGKYQVEVFHPSADQARRLVLSGEVRQVR